MCMLQGTLRGPPPVCSNTVPVAHTKTSSIPTSCPSSSTRCRPRIWLQRSGCVALGRQTSRACSTSWLRLMKPSPPIQGRQRRTLMRLWSSLVGSDNFWSAFCVFHAHFWGKMHSFKICALKNRNDFRQLKRNNFKVEKCKREENLSKFLNNMAYKTVTSVRGCVIKRNFM